MIVGTYEGRTEQLLHNEYFVFYRLVRYLLLTDSWGLSLFEGRLYLSEVPLRQPQETLAVGITLSQSFYTHVALQVIKTSEKLLHVLWHLIPGHYHICCYTSTSTSWSFIIKQVHHRQGRLSVFINGTFVSPEFKFRAGTFEVGKGLSVARLMLASEKKNKHPFVVYSTLNNF